MSEINKEAQDQIEKIAEACKKIKQKVVIWSLAYNHEPYIRDALEGFVMQKTEFPFVAIIHDDASTDGTAAIIKEYAQKYPDIILPIFEKENQYSKGDGSLDNIMKAAMEAAGAEYIAMCESDDYWTDPHKLQKQVSFLDLHSDYSLCFHSVRVISDGGEYRLDCFAHLTEKEYNGAEIIKKWTVPTCSTLLRSYLINLIPQNKNFQYGDNVIWLTCASYGKLFCMNSKMATYRRNNTGWTSQGSYYCNIKQIQHHIGLYEEFGNKFGKELNNKLLYWYAITFISGVRNLSISSLKYLIIGIRKYRISYISKVCGIIYNHFK